MQGTSTRRALAAALAALLLAGCLGAAQEPGPEAADADDAPAPGSTDPAGDDGSDSATPDTPADDASPTAPEPAALPFDETGNLPTRVDFLGGTPSITMGQPFEEYERWWPFDVDAHVVGARLVMDWTPAEGTEELALLFGPAEDDGNRLSDGYERLEGAPPLELDLSGVEWRAGKFVVAAWWVGGDVVQKRDPTSFTIRGELLLDAADADDAAP